MLKSLPYNQIAEETILGIVLLDSSYAIEVLSELTEDDFFANDKKNQKIFRAMKSLYDQQKGIDITTVASQLQLTKEYEMLGGTDYLTYLTSNVTNFEYLKFYIDSLKDNTLLRNLLVEINKIQKSYETEKIEDISGFVSKAEKKIVEITSKRKISGFERTPDLATKVYNQILSTKGSEDSLAGISCGYPSLDKVINGFSKGDEIIVAARTSVGKSAFALNVALKIAKSTKKTVAFFSYEMQSDIMMKRIFAIEGNVSLKHIQSSYLPQDEKIKINEAKTRLQNVNLYIDCDGGTTIDDIALKTKKLKEEKGDIALVVVDYIGLINESKFGKKAESDQVKIANFSRQLKQYAGELDTVFLVVCQLNRGVEQRENKQPLISDLRQSGQIEQDADKILLLYRPGYYKSQGVNGDKNSDEQNENNNIEDTLDPTRIVIAKNRNGKTGYADLWFEKETGTFSEPDESSKEDIKKAFEK